MQSPRFSPACQITQSILICILQSLVCREVEKQSCLVEQNGENAAPDRDDTDNESLMASQPHQASAGPGEGCQKSTPVATSLLKASLCKTDLPSNLK